MKSRAARVDRWHAKARTAASLVVLLIWVYYSSQLVPMGAEFMRIHAKRRTLKSPSAGWLWRCFSGGCSATSANAISAPAERASGRPSRRSFVCFALTATKFDEPQRRVANGQTATRLDDSKANGVGTVNHRRVRIEARSVGAHANVRV